MTCTELTDRRVELLDRAERAQRIGDHERAQQYTREAERLASQIRRRVELGRE
jgi:uncharacterized protein HemY